MKIDNIKDLQALVKMCRKTGIKSIEVDGVKLQLGDEPISKKRNAAIETDKIEVDKQYSEEELMFWSSQPNG